MANPSNISRHQVPFQQLSAVKPPLTFPNNKCLPSAPPSSVGFKPPSRPPGPPIHLPLPAHHHPAQIPPHARPQSPQITHPFRPPPPQVHSSHLIPPSQIPHSSRPPPPQISPSSRPPPPQIIHSYRPPTPQIIHSYRPPTPQIIHSSRPTSPQITHSSRPPPPQIPHSSHPPSPQIILSSRPTSPQIPHSSRPPPQIYHSSRPPPPQIHSSQVRPSSQIRPPQIPDSPQKPHSPQIPHFTKIPPSPQIPPSLRPPATQIHPSPSSLHPQMPFPHPYPSQILETEDVSDGDIQKSVIDEQNLRNQDKQWVQTWLSNIGAYQRCKNQDQTGKSLMISDYKKIISEIIILNENLEHLNEDLKENINDQNYKWVEKYETSKTMQNRIDSLKNEIENKVLWKDFLRKTRKAIKKKERRKRVSKEIYMSAKNAEIERELVDQKITQWQKSFITQQKDEKRNLALQKTVDHTLAEVKSKISETQQAINLIGSLKKLRQLRYKNALNKGANIPTENSLGFENVTSELLQLLNSRMDIYQAEKHSLKVILDIEKEEDAGKQIEENKKKKSIIHKKKVALARRLLFGKKTVPEPDDPVHSFYSFYDSANTSMNDLISIRTEWDKFIVPKDISGGSQIPTGWVNPPHPSDSIWAEYLISKI